MTPITSNIILTGCLDKPDTLFFMPIDVTNRNGELMCVTGNPTR
ncbi:MAG TPA: hypothetical protein VN367_06525 [Chlorobaculum sp.]|jgi:hypothetical protein|nr:hypothetical protein [Chlorobaculum sp.]